MNALYKPGWIFVLVFTLAACSLRKSTIGMNTPTIQIVTPNSPKVSQTRSVPSPPGKKTMEPSPTRTTTLTAPPTLAPTLTPIPSITIRSYPIFGVQLIRLTEVEGIKSVVDLHGYWVQAAAVSWAVVEPREGDRNWGAIGGSEREWENAVELGLVPIVTVMFTPIWAQKVPGYSCGPIKPEKLESFADFMHDLVERYSQSPFNIQYWQIWNEPDAGLYMTAPDSPWGCWGDQDDPNYYGGEYYGEMLEAVYPAMKSANPEAQVILGGLALDCDPINPPESPPGSGQYKDCTSGRFLEGILRNGGGSYFDGVSYHAYDYYYGELGKFGNSNWNSTWDSTGPILVKKTNYIKRLLSSYGYTDKLLMNTETAVICGKTGSEPDCQSGDFSMTKAYYLVQSNVVALAEGLDANLWYSLRGWRASELVDRWMQPLPVFEAYRFIAVQLEGVGFVRELVEFSGVKGYEFEFDGSPIWILWSLTEEEHTIQLDSIPAVVFDVFGESLPTGKVMNISIAPVYIKWTK